MACPSMLGDHSTRLAPAIRDMIPLAEDGTFGYGLASSSPPTFSLLDHRTAEAGL